MQLFRAGIGWLQVYRTIVATRSTIAFLTLYEFPGMAETAFCYHCRQHHPKTEMRQIETKAGKRWRCIRSIEATRQGQAAREAYGRQVSEMNKSEAQSRARLSKPIVV